MNAQTTGPVATEMLLRLNSALSPSRIELIDDSEQHRGHGGYNPAGESHFTLRIESPAFAGKSRVERQRMIYAALGDLMRERVHALSINASAPDEGAAEPA
jgi:BolA protein